MAESITLQTSDSNIQQSDTLGRISFAASNEVNSADARLIGATIHAEAEGEFTEVANPTSLVFSTASSESALGKLKITSSGYFLPLLNNTYDIGSSSFVFRNLYVNSGIFTNLSVGGDSVSVVGHNHTSSNITDFNSSVSGLLPIISNSGDNRLLTSTGSTVGINAENNLTFDGSLLSISGNFVANTGTINQIVFNTSLADPNLLQGQLQWNATEGTLDLGVNENYAMHLGEEMLYRIRNTTGMTLRAGQPVYASGLSPGANNRIEVNLYVADGSVREVQFMGLITEDVSDNGTNGYATQFGFIRKVDTRGNATTNGTTNKLWTTGEPEWYEGDILYVHPTVAGKLTKIEPKHSISVAIITSKGTNGKIFVRPTSYGHLSDNHDVDTSGATNGQFLQYNSSTDYWLPSSSGNFTSLQVNGTEVSVSGHSHISSNITDFNSSVSGLLPTIANSGDNRVLTSTGSAVGINAESNFTFNGSLLTAPSGNFTNSLRVNNVDVVLTDNAQLTNSRTPTGTAGGDLTGTYPNPTIASGAVVTANIADSAVTDAKIAGVAASKLTGTLPDARLSSNVTVNQNLRWAMQTTNTSIDWLPRGHGTIGNAAAFSGNLMLAFFTAPYSFTATTLTFITGGTATASLSLCRFALFTVSETIVDSVTGTSPIITMVARTANDTTIGNASQTIYSRAFATDGYPASYSIVAGTRYAAGLLVVGSTAGTWQAGTVTTGAITRLPPMAAGVVTGLSDMPTAATTVSNGNFMIYGRIS